MRRALFLLACTAAAAALAPPARADEVAVFRVADEGGPRVSVARASRGTAGAATVVVVLETARGDRLVLRRTPGEGGATTYEVGFGGPSSVTFVRRGDVLVLQAGRSLSLVEGDLARPTVRCWVSTLVSNADSKLLDAAGALRILKEAPSGPGLDDAYVPMQLLWQVAEASDVRPRGAVKLEKGPFTGEAWDRLRRAASDELGKR